MIPLLPTFRRLLIACSRHRLAVGCRQLQHGALIGIFAVSGFLSGSPAFAADIGRVLLAAGEAFAVREGKPELLARGSAIQARDTLRTGAASNLQVRFTDESILSLRENTEIRIDDYRFAGKEDGTERAFFRLLKGGFRTITGIIGRTNHDHYRMGSAIATIGIRGTDYAATLCQEDCVASTGQSVRDGLYGRVIGVSHGTSRIIVGNERAERVLGVGENFFVADKTSPIEQLLVAPDFVGSGIEQRRQINVRAAAWSAGGEPSSGSDGASKAGPGADQSPPTHELPYFEEHLGGWESSEDLSTGIEGTDVPDTSSLTSAPGSPQFVATEVRNDAGIPSPFDDDGDDD